ncbi:MAG TPA: hypothetical protein VMQ76_13245 [Terracidiphilus sp.]|nr:hypothetical protein [Terracidiphilus sp.]
MRQNLDSCLQELKCNSDPKFTGHRAPDHPMRSSRERSIAVTKIQEAIMWLGMDLKSMNEEGVPGTENPYPQSYNPASPVSVAHFDWRFCVCSFTLPLGPAMFWPLEISGPAMFWPLEISGLPIISSTIGATK